MLLRIITFSISVLFLLVGCSRQPSDIQWEGKTMGSSYSIKIIAPPPTITTEQLKMNVEQWLQTFDKQVSTYRPDSELALFNKNLSTEWVSVSPPIVTLIDAASEISTLSGGAFDVTVAPLVNLWGFGARKTWDDPVLPSEEAIVAALAKVGYKHLHTRQNPAAIRKDIPDLEVDLSGIATGYAADELAAYLDSLQIVNYMVEISGELRLKGVNAQGTAWRIAVEEPRADERLPHRLLQVTNTAVTTAGDYRHYFEKEGKRYSHLIDARTGRPITHPLASVTVIHPSAMFADGLDTALMVMGEEAAYELAVKQNLAIFMLIKQGDKFVDRMSPAFQPYLMKQ